MRKVFLSADDFGRSEARNRAIDECFKKGWIKSSGLIVTGQYLQDAINTINRGGYIGNVHCHFNLSGNITGEDSLDKPLTEGMAKDKSFCSDGLFNSYKGLPNRPMEILKWRIVYKELCAQYDKFLSITDGKGNEKHVDFHVWYNLTWPVAVALNIFTWTHRIKSVRYTGVHFQTSKRVRLFRIISWNPFVKGYRSGNIDYFINRPEVFKTDPIIELYCHPNYVDSILLDDSVSYLGHKKQTLETHIEKLKNIPDLQLVSWADESLLN